MVGRGPQWDARRIRTPIPRALPGYMLTPYSPGGLVYVYGASSPTLWEIDADNGQIVHEGQPSTSAVAVSTIAAPCCCPADGSLTVAVAATGGPPAASRSVGLVNRGGEGTLGFPYQASPTQGLVDSCNGPAGWSVYSLGPPGGSGQTNIVGCRKSDLAVDSALIASSGSDIIGLDCDRAGNIYAFHSNPPIAGHYLERRTNNGAVITWFVNPGSGNTLLNRYISVGTPELSSGTWFQSVYVSGSGFLSKFDCRTGIQLATVAIGYSNLTAASDGLYVTAAGDIQKLDLDTLAVIWTHNPATVETPPLPVTGHFTVDCCGNLFYLAGPKSNGAIELRKLNSDGSLAWVQSFFLPWAGAWLIPDCGKTGGYSWPSEPWIKAGSPAISF